ncbi:hypothetical protein ES708_05602 [subsurface metagenome]
MRIKAFISLGLVSLLSLIAVPVYANGIPDLPHAFYGTLTVNGSTSSSGYQVEARGTGVITTDVPRNPITTTVAGEYGSDGLYLLAQGDIPPLATITFYVNGRLATTNPATVEWHSGETSEVDLSVTIPTGGGGGGGFGALTVETDLFGTTGSFKISSDGEVQETIEATSEDGNLTITIDEGTIALDEDGNRLRTLEAAIDENPPDPPEGTYIIGLAYNFEPDGATFDPAITLEYTYDPDDIPEGVAEKDLVIAYYDEYAGKWVELICTVDTANNTITAYVDHFTTFAILGTVKPAAFSSSMLDISPLEVNIGETVTISLLVNNTGGKSGSYTVSLKIDGVKEADKSVTVDAGDSETVSFSVTKEETGDYSVEVDGLKGSFTVAPALAPAPPPAPAPPAPPVTPAPPVPAPAPAPAINWPVIGGIIGGVVVVGLLIFFLARRRAH